MNFGVKIALRHVVSQLWHISAYSGIVRDQDFKICIYTLVVVKCEFLSEKCFQPHCVAVMTHEWLLVNP